MGLNIPKIDVLDVFDIDMCRTMSVVETGENTSDCMNILDTGFSGKFMETYTGKQSTKKSGTAGGVTKLLVFSVLLAVCCSDTTTLGSVRKPGGSKREVPQYKNSFQH